MKKTFFEEKSQKPFLGTIELNAKNLHYKTPSNGHMHFIFKFDLL